MLPLVLAVTVVGGFVGAIPGFGCENVEGTIQGDICSPPELPLFLSAFTPPVVVVATALVGVTTRTLLVTTGVVLGLLGVEFLAFVSLYT